jgi:hypothetical protein
MAKTNRQKNGKASNDVIELGIGPAQRGLEVSTESRYLRSASLPRRLRQKPAKSFRAYPA